MEDSAVFGVGSCSAVDWAGKLEDDVERETGLHAMQFPQNCKLPEWV